MGARLPRLPRSARRRFLQSGYRYYTELWLQGLYVYNAIGALVPVLNPFSKEHKAKPYLKNPIPITEEEREEEQRRKEQRFIEFMDRLAEAGKK